MGYMRRKIDKQRSKKLFHKTAGPYNSHWKNGMFNSRNPSVMRGGYRI